MNGNNDPLWMMTRQKSNQDGREGGPQGGQFGGLSTAPARPNIRKNPYIPGNTGARINPRARELIMLYGGYYGQPI